MSLLHVTKLKMQVDLDYIDFTNVQFSNISYEVFFMLPKRDKTLINIFRIIYIINQNLKVALKESTV